MTQPKPPCSCWCQCVVTAQASLLLLVSMCCDTVQASLLLLVSMCCDTAQASVLLLVSMCCDTAQASLLLLVSVCCDTAQAKADPDIIFTGDRVTPYMPFSWVLSIVHSVTTSRGRHWCAPPLSLSLFDKPFHCRSIFQHSFSLAAIKREGSTGCMLEQ